MIESISTNKPRIEWKKIKNGGPSYVYFNEKVSGKVESKQDGTNKFKDCVSLHVNK